MKKLLRIATILFFCGIVSYAQNEKINKTGLIRVVDGDTTFFYKTFEIDIDKKKVYMINPVMNYYDIQGGKPKYEIKVTKEKWNKIMNLLSEINLFDYEEMLFYKKSYSIVLFFKNDPSKTYTTQKESAIENLKEIIKTLRE